MDVKKERPAMRLGYGMIMSNCSEDEGYVRVGKVECGGNIRLSDHRDKVSHIAWTHIYIVHI
jgi:hypothetical protein